MSDEQSTQTPASPTALLPQPEQEQRPAVVGVGASAGGLAAFTDFLRHLPPDTGLAFVFVQHLDPQQPSLLPELLASHTAMPVYAVVDQTPVAPNHVYLIPPNTALTISGGVLGLEPPTEAHGQRLPIDHFFRSLAQDQGARATGIVLSGTGADGTKGLAAIQAVGGLTLAQTPASAGSPGMPEQTIARGVADHVLEVAAMPALLIARAGHAGPGSLGAGQARGADTLRAITALLQQSSGHDFSRYKPTTLQRRIERRMQLLHLNSLEAYRDQLQQNRDELERLFQDLLISVTEFFRNPAAFESLAAVALLNLPRGRDATTPLRVWVPGCATGEEAYSIAILLHELLAKLDTSLPVQIFATDIDEAALAVARRGHYDASITAQLTPERLARFFIPDGQGYQVIKPLRERCLFSAHNLISDPPFGRMDLIACRNLLIYFDIELQRQMLPVFHYALAPGGFLFLGSAESAMSGGDTPELFRAVDASNRIYQRRERLVRPQVNLPWIDRGRQTVRGDGAGGRALPTRGLAISDTLERILLRDYAPTAVAIDEQGTIAYLSGRTYPYLVVPGGIPTTNLLALIHSDLQLPLRAAMRVASQEQTRVVREDLLLHTAEGAQRLTLTVQPLGEPAPATMLLVVLQTLGPPVPLSLLAHPGEAPSTGTEALIDELQRMRENLEATIGELKEANLDMMAANEELRSLNEELQAANEELQTSKEEIQSINEELQTVNAELSRKIEELDRANADLANLFASAQIPVIFLHGDGRIARFTPHATELFALIDSDVGRPISDFQARFSIGDLPQQIGQVIQSHIPAELVVRRPEQNRWWSVQIRPYRTLVGAVDGVVLTFADITTLKQAELVLQGAHDELERRVAERTAELAVANVALQTQVAERMQSEQARQQLIQQLVTAQEEERRHLARELHDQLAQDLTGLILGLKVLHDRVPVGDQSVERIAQLQAVAVDIGREVRDMVVRLRPSVLDDLGLVLALSNYVEQWSARANVGVDLHTRGLDEERLPLAVETTIYRLVQEALTNVLKHAHASEVSVIIERSTNEVRLIIEDDGSGFSVPVRADGTDDQPRLGLLGMQERVALLNGTLTVESAPGSGTTIFARLPLDGA
ncbi:MAG: chemotaxis protein CheB [Oscillochloridaceae bacterium umkhey_bin13]